MHGTDAPRPSHAVLCRIACECGFSVTSYDLDELAEEARRHAQREHGMDLPYDQLKALARPVVDGEPDDPSAYVPHTPRPTLPIQEAETQG